MGRHKAGLELCNVVYDVKSNEWIDRELGGFPSGFITRRCGYQNLKYACDGGLVYFVPHTGFLYNPILVGNPLTDECKALPCVPYTKKTHLHGGACDGRGYKMLRTVILVRDGNIGEDYATHCYDSKTGVWSSIESCLVYGGGSTLLWTSENAPCVFDCTTRTMYELRHCSSFEGVKARRKCVPDVGVKMPFCFTQCNFGRFMDLDGHHSRAPDTCLLCCMWEHKDCEIQQRTWMRMGLYSERDPYPCTLISFD